MQISLIWAMDENRLIGVENRLPWKLPADMKWFRRHTLGKPIIMGRKTFDSFGGRPLPERLNIVVSRDAGYQAAGAVVVHSIEAALAAAGDAPEAMVIGGASFYEQMLPRAERLYITWYTASLQATPGFRSLTCMSGARWRGRRAPLTRRTPTPAASPSWSDGVASVPDSR